MNQASTRVIEIEDGSPKLLLVNILIPDREIRVIEKAKELGAELGLGTLSDLQALDQGEVAGEPGRAGKLESLQRPESPGGRIKEDLNAAAPGQLKANWTMQLPISISPSPSTRAL